ncbi:MAG: hypothetical protein A2287_03955 [Candidatus Melainabacteria bacterium RIFOXYA12_FULL_32_12]|nr:MAG: hypothetical protein A2255_07885 [Candidatus Melainabacteria bacterium RIFOXYA2_FULL_32_9]OGI31631.1 MAG: hypothetical protein A2287_03955 [Candidatus Melainabacteria bacterium RIFOXYA12_FULL_32_12]
MFINAFQANQGFQSYQKNNKANLNNKINNKCINSTKDGVEFSTCSNKKINFKKTLMQVLSKSIPVSFRHFEKFTNDKGVTQTINFTGETIKSQSYPENSKQEFFDDLKREGKITQKQYNKIKKGGIARLYELDRGFRYSLESYFVNKFRGKPITSLEGDNMIYYYSGLGYRRLTPVLKEGKPLTQDLEIFKQYLDEGLDMLSDYKGVTYRGSNSYSEIDILKPGDMYKPKCYLSASASNKMIQRFGSNYVLVIKSKTGKSIEKFSGYPEECEVLFKPNTTFKILKKTTKGNKKVIYLEEV